MQRVLRDVPQRDEARGRLTQTSGQPELPSERTMYICLCNGITDNHIAEAVEEGASSLCDLKTRLGIATCCGRCAECAQFVLEEQLAGTSPAQIT